MPVLDILLLDILLIFLSARSRGVDRQSGRTSSQGRVSGGMAALGACVTVHDPVHGF
jgi:hypothetical protein